MTDLFAELNAVAIAAPVPKGTVIFQNRDPGTAVYLIRSGRVALVWIDANDVTPIDLHGPGRILGLPAALNGQYSATAKVLEDSELGFVPSDRVVAVLESNPSLMQAAVRLLGEEVARVRSMVSAVPESGLRAVDRAR
ncbi:MAG TPA: cyclic nucleotide-binding domain-containing protein [Acidobacteriaceae bacterium]